jgi:serine/threonine protein kinase
VAHTREIPPVGANVPAPSSKDGSRRHDLDTVTADSPNIEMTMPSLGAARSASPTTVPAPPLPPSVDRGTVVGGKYELLHLIAEGGMGKVYLAKHVELRMHVAVKIMHDHIALNAEHVERFHREALAASRLGHPNIVKVLDFGSVGTTFYIVMEYIDGKSLCDWLDEQTDADTRCFGRSA